MWMYDGKMKSLYQVFSPVTYILSNVHRAANSSAIPMHEVNPYFPKTVGGGDTVIRTKEQAMAVWKSWGVKV